MRVYFQIKLLGVFLLAMIAGLPLALTASTLTTMLTEYELKLSLIGLFAFVGIPYSFKYLWSPVVDNLKIPILNNLLGRRKSWMILVLSLLGLAIFSISLLDIASQLYLVALITLCVAILSATYDIIFDAFRIEMLDKHEQAAGASVYVFGYRIGMIVSTAGALYIAHFFSWQAAYVSMAACVLPGIIITLMMTEPDVELVQKDHDNSNIFTDVFHAYWKPLSEFFSRGNAVQVLIFVTLFKLGDAYAGMMTSPFLITIGFSKLEIANIVKGIGVAATFAGIFTGGALASRVSMSKAVFIALIVQIVSNLLFIIQVKAGHNNYVLTGVICAENFAGGVGTSILMAYLANLCNIKFTATQYALLSSFATLGRSTISGSAGYVAEAYGWTNFFILSALMSVPALFLIKSQFKASKAHIKEAIATN